MSNGGPRVAVTLDLVNNLSAGLNKAASDVGGLNRAVGSLFKGFVAFHGVRFLKSSLLEFVEAEKSMKQLSIAVESLNNAAGASTPNIERWVQAIASASRFDDEDIRDAASALIRFGGAAGASEKALKAAAEMASRTGTSVKEAAETMGRASQGMTRGLKSVGVELTNAQKKIVELGSEAQAMQAITNAVFGKFGGSYVKDVQTFGGSVAQLSKMFKELKEAVGEAAAAILVDFFGVFRDLAAKGLTISSKGKMFQGETGAEERRRQADDLHISRLRAIGPSGKKEEAKAKRFAELDAQHEAKLAKQLELEEKRKKKQEEYLKDLEQEEKRLKAILDARTKLVHAYLKSPEHTFGAFRERVGLTTGQMGVYNLPGGTMDMEAFKEMFAEAAQLEAEIVRENAREMLTMWRDAFQSMTARMGDAIKGVFNSLAPMLEKSFGRVGADSILKTADIMGGSISQGLSKFFGVDLKLAAAGPGWTGEFDEKDRPIRGVGGARARERQARLQQGLKGLETGAQYIPSIMQRDYTQELKSKDIAKQIATVWATSSSWIANLVATVVIGVTSYLKINQQQKEYPYGVPSIRGGEAMFRRGQNISAGEAADIVKRMQETFNEIYNGMVGVLLKFPMRFREFLTRDFIKKFDVDPVLGKDRGGDFGRAASKVFWKDLDRYIAHGMPKEIAERFKEPLSNAFTSMGLTMDRFEEIWDHLTKLDPKKAHVVLGQLADALMTWDEAMSYFNQSSGFARGFDLTGLMESRRGQALRDLQDPGREKWDNARKKIQDAAQALDVAFGDDRVRAAKNLASAVLELANAEREFLRVLEQVRFEVNKTFQNFSEFLELEGMVTPEGTPDWQQRLDYAQKQADLAYQRLQQAPTVEAAREASNDFMNWMQKIWDFSRNLENPADRESWRKWLQDSTKLGQDAFNKRLDEIGEAVTKENNRILELVRSSWTDFLGILDSAGSSFENLGGNLSDLADAAGAAAGNLRQIAAISLGQGTSSSSPVTVIVTPPDTFASTALSARGRS